MLEQLRATVNLQIVESRRKALLSDIEAKPRRLAEAQGRVKEHEEAVAKAKEAVETGRKDKRRLETEIEDVKTKISKYRDQLFSVKTNKEYSALLHEIEQANAHVRGIEDRILEGMEREEAMNLEHRNREAELKAAKEKLAQEDKELTAIAARCEAELVHVEKDRAELRAKIERELLSHFDRVFNQRGGVAVTGLAGDSCEACKIRIRPQKLSEIRRHEKIHFCDSCKRILVYEDPVPVSAPSSTES